MVVCLTVATFLAACIDAATRVAEGLEAGSGKLRHSAAPAATVDHIPEPTSRRVAPAITPSNSAKPRHSWSGARTQSEVRVHPATARPTI